MVNQRIAIIPARGGSKRIPGKNVMDFLGKPMIAWTIEAALGSGCFRRVLVSTDDPDIAETAVAWGAEAPFLRTQYNDDHTPVSQATQSALRQAVEFWQEDYDEVVQLMANCPLRGSVSIQKALAQFDAEQRDFQISCFRYGWMNPWWAATLDEGGQPTSLFPEAKKQRSQDLPPLYCPTGAIWVAKAAGLLEGGTFYGDGYRFEPLAWQAAVDIDDLEDLALAQAVARQWQDGLSGEPEYG